MPELPEVETVCKGLSEKILKKKIKELKILNPNLRTKIPVKIESLFLGRYIKKIIRRGKNGIIFFNCNHVIIFHLGMTGKFKIFLKKPLFEKHDHLFMKLGKSSYLLFNDIRKFGSIDIMRMPIDIINFRGLGHEPKVINSFASDICNKIRNSRRNIKNILLDQSIIAGIGNIYASEILFRSGISPKAKGNTISEKRLKRMIIEVKNVLDLAIEKGGSTIKNYSNAEGSLGYFQNNLFVYDREGLSCLICKSLIIKIKQSGRSSYYCRKCQR